MSFANNSSPERGFTESDFQIDEFSLEKAIRSKKPKDFAYGKDEASIFGYVRKQDHLPAAEQLKLIKQAKRGDERSRDKLVVSNLRLVMNLAAKYKNRGLEYDDLFQEGVMGLMHAINKFSTGKGTKFSTYASLWIRQFMQRAVTDKSLPIRLPVSLHMDKAKVIKASQKLERLQERMPTSTELAEETNLPKYRVELALKASKVICSTDMSIGDGDSTLASVLPNKDAVSPEEKIEYELLKKQLKECLQKLDETEAYILYNVFGLDNTEEVKQKEIAEVLGIKERAVGKRKNRAMTKIFKKCPKLREFLDS